MKCLAVLLLAMTALAAQVTNPACPNATGPDPHCSVITWTVPTSGVTPTGYNVYTGGTTPGNCATVTASTCTKLTPTPLIAGTLTFTYNSSPTVSIADGSTHYFVITSVNGTAESGPSTEVSAITPFLVPSPPATPQVVTH